MLTFVPERGVVLSPVTVPYRALQDPGGTLKHQIAPYSPKPPETQNSTPCNLLKPRTKNVYYIKFLKNQNLNFGAEALKFST